MNVYNGEVIIAFEEEAVVKAGKFTLIIKHNDVGVSIDLYDNTTDESEPLEETQWWFDDYDQPATP